MAARSERRRHVRKQVDLAAECQLDGDDRLPARVSDLSIGGCFVQVEPAPSFGAKLSLRISLPGAAEPVTVDGIVRWTSPEGLGVQFGAVGAKDTYELSEYLGGLS